MANEDETLAFEITDQDLHDASDFTNVRRPKRSKEYATYGVWAQDSDEDDPDGARPAFGGGGKRRGGGNYSAPVGFVSAGIQGKKKDEKKKEEEEAEEDDDGEEEAGGGGDDDGDSSGDEGGYRPGLGVGGGGLGYGRHQAKNKRFKFTPDQGQIAGFRTKDYQAHTSLGKGFGDWEKHTRGIGAKLLMKMGYEAGKGLGKDLQGRSQIVEAHLRKGRGAIGAYGQEGGRPKKDKEGKERAAATVGDKPLTKAEVRLEGQKSQWRKSGVPKTKYLYKTADEVLEEGKWRKINVDAKDTGSLGKVIDMTGREQRVLSGYHAIATAKTAPDEDGGEEERDAAGKPCFALPELLHNVNLLVDSCEEELITADRKLRHHRNRVEVLQREEEKLSELVEREKETIGALHRVLEKVEKLEGLHEAGRLSLEDALDMFRAIAEDHPREYRVYELPHIATTIVAPLLKAELKDWRPLDRPRDHVPELQEWKDILRVSDQQPHSDDYPDPFYTLVWEAWMPSVRVAVNAWNTREPDPLIEFLKAWQEVAPPQILQNLRDLVILPRLQSEVEQWNPMRDPVPLHSWLHPWLELLGAQLEVVYPTIRQKLSTALTAWHPSDKSARLILLPWKDVFERGAMQVFLAKNVLPKLETALHKMQVNPQNQIMNEWSWVWDWKDFMTPADAVGLLQKHFFPKWLNVLGAWLGQNPNYQEVMAWFQGWKRQLTELDPELMKTQTVAQALNEAVQMMNHAVSSDANPMSMQPGAFESVRYLASREANTASPPMPPRVPPQHHHQPPPPPPPPTISEFVPESFKELVAKKCSERNIHFVPVHGRKQDGKQVYKCGNSNIYLDDFKVFALQNGMWIQVELNHLLKNAL